MDAQIQGQYGTCRQLYTKARRLANVSDKDPHLLAREEDMRRDAAAGRTPAAAQREGSCRTSRIKSGRTGRPVPTEEEMVIMSHPLDSTLAHGPIRLPTAHGNAGRHGGSASPVVDHLCYRAATLPEYLDLKEALAGSRGLAGGGDDRRPPHCHLSPAPARLLATGHRSLHRAGRPQGGSQPSGRSRAYRAGGATLHALVATHPGVAFKTPTSTTGATRTWA